MLILVVFFFGIKSSPVITAMLKGVKPVVVGLLLWTAYDMARSVFGVQKLGWGKALAQGWVGLLFAAGAFVLLTFTKINPAIIVVVSAALGFLIFR